MLLYISFRGTASWQMAVNDLDTAQVHVTLWPWPATRRGEVMVHRGFWQSYLSVRGPLLKMVEAFAAAEEVRSGGTAAPLCVCVTGHSAGGALATFCALDLACSAYAPRLRVAMYTFGSPRVGNKHFATLFDARVPNAFRVVYEGDIVTSQPKHSQSWIYLVCCCLFLGPIGYVWNPLLLRTYKHAGVPVILLDSPRGDVLIDPAMIERNLYMNWPRSIKSHMMVQYSLGA